jgi:hypothetical protein
MMKILEINFVALLDVTMQIFKFFKDFSACLNVAACVLFFVKMVV